ncbi:hypothetical protein NQ318_018941 [Aromia moschata]|uniref:Uncharacterized protein n=1 Tax=Aromia moschata TaxID=1265417 RepID=A0AAV8ZG26_9CUCU|nr:hypothetical protein NQ318_018941 [Aromia moschata]
MNVYPAYKFLNGLKSLKRDSCLELLMCTVEFQVQISATEIKDDKLKALPRPRHGKSVMRRSKSGCQGYVLLVFMIGIASNVAGVIICNER